jgi:hypothetical protein
MITRGIPRAAGLLKQTVRCQRVSPSLVAVGRRNLTSPTQPLNATEVTIERDALLSPSARIVSILMYLIFSSSG